MILIRLDWKLNKIKAITKTLIKLQIKKKENQIDGIIKMAEKIIHKKLIIEKKIMYGRECATNLR